MPSVLKEYLRAISLFPLSFKDRGIESRFRDYYFEANLSHGRLCHILAIFFFVADGIRDNVLFPESLPALMFIRYVVITPVFLTGLVFSYAQPKLYQRCWQPLFAGYVLITGAGSLAMVMVVPPPLGASLYVGVIYCLIFGYTFIRLRFSWAAAAGFLLTCAYIAVSLWLTRLPKEVVWVQFPFVIGVNLLGMFVAYHIDFTARRNFFLRELLREEKEKVDAVNDELERRVKERTEAVVAANRTLQRNIDALKRSETERQRLEAHLRQAHKMEAIGTLAGGIAHDFNNILSAVIGYTELALGDMEKESPLRRHLFEVLSAGNRAKELVKQILTFARQSDEDVKPIAVYKVMAEVLRLIRSSIPSTIEIRQRIDSEALIMGNATQVHQILMNLLTNAAQAMEPEGGVLDVTLEEITVQESLSEPFHELGNGSYLKITVSDTGQGIPPQFIESIFEPYFTTKPQGEGTGMGLALVHGIVEGYGGRIAVESRLGEGTVFTVLLPVTVAHDGAASSEALALPTGKENIMYVDDEPAIASMMEETLKRLGYRVTTRTSSIEALALFRSRPQDFDLVVTDMTMPSMTGDKLAVALLGIRGDIPVILCTGYNKSLSPERIVEIGIRALVSKPVILKDLAMTLRSVLDDAAGTPKR